MNKKQKLIEALVVRWARRHAQGSHPMSRGVRGQALRSYMRNWLTEHGELPSGVHTVSVRKGNWNGVHTASMLRFNVDFAELAEADHSLPSVSPELAK